MRKIALLVAIALNLSAIAQQIIPSDVEVVGVGTVSKNIGSDNNVNRERHQGTTEFDRKTDMFIAEPDYECLYNYTINNPAKGDTVKERTSCVLQIGNGIGRFSDYTTFSVDSADQVINKDESDVLSLIKRELSNDYCFEEIVYQNYPGDKMTVYGIIAPNYFVYEETLNPVEWTLTEDVDSVCGYQCMKAVGEYGGRQWEVWFTSEIPVAMGPWKLGGLPGLIMKAKDSDNLHCFEAISFRKGRTPIYKPRWPAAVKTERAKFVRQKNQTTNPMENIMHESIREISVYKGDHGNGVIAVNGVPIRNRDNGYVPRELE